DTLFSLPLRGNPKRANLEWTEWMEGSWNANESRPTPEEAFFVRYRVLIDEPPPPPPSADEIEANQAAEEQATFDSIPADAPIATWLPYTAYGTREDFLKQAIHNIQSRENFVDELGALITGDDHETAAAGLWMIRH